MSKIPINSAASSKRRKKNQSKTRRSRMNGRNKAEAIKQICIPTEDTRERSRNQIENGSTDHTNGEAVAVATHIPIRSVAPTNNAGSYLRETSPSSSQVEAKNVSEVFLPTECCGSPFVDIRNEGFTPGTPGNIMRSHKESVSQADLDVNFTWPSVQSGMRAAESEEEAVGTLTAVEFCPSPSPPFRHTDFNFGYSSMASSPDTAFDFSIDLEIDWGCPVPQFPTPNWPSPGFPSVFTSPVAGDEVYVDASPTGFRADFAQDKISDSSVKNSDMLGSLCGQSLEQDPVNPNDTKNPLLNGNFHYVEYGTHLSEIPPSAPTVSSGKGLRKRPSSGDDGCEGGEDTNTTNNRREKLLACPFHKKDPQRYQECGKYTLRRIKDVKQHIYRLHCKPELYCSRCFENFKCSNERDSHIREGNCTLKEMPIRDDIISDNQRKELKDCKSRGTSKQQQWMELWEVIFPGSPHPRSPHIENGQAELLSSLRSYWEGNAEEIIARSIGKQDPGQIREIVDSIFNHFESNPTDWDLSTSKETGGALPPAEVSENSVEGMLSWHPDMESSS